MKHWQRIKYRRKFRQEFTVFLATPFRDKKRSNLDPRFVIIYKFYTEFSIFSYHFDNWLLTRCQTNALFAKKQVNKQLKVVVEILHNYEQGLVFMFRKNKIPYTTNLEYYETLMDIFRIQSTPTGYFGFCFMFWITQKYKIAYEQKSSIVY